MTPYYCAVVYCADACGAHFNLIEATSFPRAKSTPCFSVPAAAPPPVLRQPRDEPEVLARRDDVVLAALRQPRASNASVSSLTVRRPYEHPGNSSISQTPSISGTRDHSHYS